MVLPNLSDNFKFWVFWGFALLLIVWVVIDNFFDYGLQVYLGLLILGLIGFIGIVAWNNMNMLMPAGSVRLDNSIKIP